MLVQCQWMAWLHQLVRWNIDDYGCHAQVSKSQEGTPGARPPEAEKGSA